MNLRDIDRLVAVHVLDWLVDKDGDACAPGEDGRLYPTQLLFFSEEIEAAWMVVQAFDNFKVIRLASGAYMTQTGDHYAGAMTAPLAICKVALRAKGVEVDLDAPT